MSLTGNIVELNIGGSLFQTTKSTLIKFNGFFRTLFESGLPIPRDSSGYIFIDRDPKHFRLILNFMRDGKINLPSLKADVLEIQQEAQYYLLDDLVKICNQGRKIQKPVAKDIKPRFLQSRQQVEDAVGNSRKKAVIMVFYSTDSGSDGANKIIEIVNKYNEEFDVYFTPQCDVSDPIYWKCQVHDTSCRRVFYCVYLNLDVFIMKHFG
uniref:BTB domain-containing protein n=1 Tax=Caenorhabditis tropicalis TaxID=1561998 RepID=A0A1I7TCK6_9PELO